MAAHADHGGVDLGTPGVVDYADHKRTYLGFLALLKWSTLSIAVILILMAFFLL